MLATSRSLRRNGSQRAEVAGGRTRSRRRRDVILSFLKLASFERRQLDKRAVD